jgi:DNA-binding response OmpR family regulator
MAEGDSATVLVVDDEKEVADGYALRLRGEYDTETAYGGEAALSVLGDTDVDVVLLDRRMPNLSGDDVLAEIRDRGIGCRVVMLTAIDPDFGILDMPFDDYLCKPVDNDDLLAVIDQQLTILAYERLSEYFAVVSTVRVIETQQPAGTLQNHDEYIAATERADRLRGELRVLMDDFETVAAEFEAIDRDPGG